MYDTLAMNGKEERPVSAIRVKPDILHQARVAAVTQRKTLGRWLEEAIEEKLEREQRQGVYTQPQNVNKRRKSSG